MSEISINISPNLIKIILQSKFPLLGINSISPSRKNLSLRMIRQDKLFSSV